jgi:hypothetical protein
LHDERERAVVVFDVEARRQLLDDLAVEPEPQVPASAAGGRGAGGGEPAVAVLHRDELHHPAVARVDVEHDVAGVRADADVASGHMPHQYLTLSASLVASARPCSVRGCLPRLSQPRRRHEQPVSPPGVCSAMTSAPAAA